ncbi:hypothetical protein PENSOL_c001G09833 [Penicillium solitum]|uniref:Uncharacterized protein n=1 Tax=Penicillium solitum TaxID=60172 RepID=A0A1V6RQV8_9EURO|nr:uncharacterized protein PENSOL_c001G09833 [Penicillium solitum]OQE03968.1 hypothetical protein PENSOL_c001G09833 [Penicillium solitum]
MSAFKTSSFARKSAITTSLDRANNEGVFSSTTSSSSRMYTSPLTRFYATPVLSIDLIRPLLLVIVDNNIDTRLGALRLTGSEHITAGAWIKQSIPLTSLCADWRIDSPIILASVLPTTKSKLIILVDTPGRFGSLRPHPELSLVEVPEPLPPELPGPTIVVAAGVPYLVSLIERYAGTRWYRSLACVRACTLSISLIKSGYRFDHPLCTPPQLAHFRLLRVTSFLRWQSRE